MWTIMRKILSYSKNIVSSGKKIFSKCFYFNKFSHENQSNSSNTYKRMHQSFTKKTWLSRKKKKTQNVHRNTYHPRVSWRLWDNSAVHRLHWYRLQPKSCTRSIFSIHPGWTRYCWEWRPTPRNRFFHSRRSATCSRQCDWTISRPVAVPTWPISRSVRLVRQWRCEVDPRGLCNTRILG